MCRNRNRGILRNIAGYLRGALLDDEAAEAAEIHVVLLIQRSLDALLESLDNGLYLYLLGTCLVYTSAPADERINVRLGGRRMLRYKT